MKLMLAYSLGEELERRLDSSYSPPGGKFIVSYGTGTIDLVALAEVALEALREPTAAMRLAMQAIDTAARERPLVGTMAGSPFGQPSFGDMWRAAIDEALR